MRAALDTWGRLDGALISVGGPPTGTIMDTPDEAWTTSFESVFVGGLRVARAVANAIEGPGSIAFVLSSSVQGAAAQPGRLQRAAARAGDGRQDARRRARPA